MGAVWIGILIAAAGGIAVAVVTRWAFGGQSKSADLDVGSVSEGWLSEQRARKDS
jgi:hypothetical protein